MRIGEKSYLSRLQFAIWHHSASFMMPNGDPQERFFYPTLALMIDFLNICVYYKASHILYCIKLYDRIHNFKENKSNGYAAHQFFVVLLLQASCGEWIHFLIACSTFGVGFVYCVLQTGISYNINEGTKKQLILLRLRASLCIVDAILMVVCILLIRI